MIALPVYSRDEGLYVYSYELHKKLEISIPHDQWVLGFFKKHQMGIGYDYDECVTGKGYAIYLDTATSMSLCERTKLGIKVRRYLNWFKRTYYNRTGEVLRELNQKGGF
jgi:phage anti-repressor protein